MGRSNNSASTASASGFFDASFGAMAARIPVDDISVNGHIILPPVSSISDRGARDPFLIAVAGEFLSGGDPSGPAKSPPPVRRSRVHPAQAGLRIRQPEEIRRPR